jgi:hypothetical protein
MHGVLKISSFSSSSSSSFRRVYCDYSHYHYYSRKNAFLLSRKRTLLQPRSVSAAQNISENNAVMTTKTTFNEKSDDDVNNGKKEKKNATKSKTFTLRPKEKHGMNRKARYVTLHFLRHAEGTHNVSREYNDPKHKDARLTDFGIQQCEKLAKAQPLLFESKSSKKKMTVATSPMTRCVQTARLCFDKESHMITEKYFRGVAGNGQLSVRYSEDDVRVEGRVWRERGFLSVGKRRGRSFVAVLDREVRIRGRAHDAQRERFAV